MLFHGFILRFRHDLHAISAIKRLLKQLRIVSSTFVQNVRILIRYHCRLRMTGIPLHRLNNYIRSVSVSQKYEKELRSVEQTVSNFETQYDTGNPVLDVVLSSKKMMCRSALITMECYMDAREMDFLDTAQICTIFGNALDNAIEYESRIEETEKRLIKVSVFSENHFLVIKISNYCEETILKSLEDPETTKENPEIHGYGIKGIRLAVEKYEGHMTIKQENNWFIVSILIPIPEKQNQTAL